jgi:hypothetical protein
MDWQRQHEMAGSDTRPSGFAFMEIAIERPTEIAGVE